MAGNYINLKTTPPDLLERLKKYPDEARQVMKATGEAALLIIHENVPPYPNTLPDQKYVRTGQLGRSLGTGEGGGQIGKADIEKVSSIGDSGFEVRFGTNLSYAPDVIGPRQKPIFKGRWWTFATIARRSRSKIVKAYDITARRLVDFLDGKG